MQKKISVVFFPECFLKKVQYKVAPSLSDSYLITMSSASTLSPAWATHFSNFPPAHTKEKYKQVMVLPQSTATLSASTGDSAPHHMSYILTEPQGLFPTALRQALLLSKTKLTRPFPHSLHSFSLRFPSSTLQDQS